MIGLKFLHYQGGMRNSFRQQQLYLGSSLQKFTPLHDAAWPEITSHAGLQKFLINLSNPWFLSPVKIDDGFVVIVLLYIELARFSENLGSLYKSSGTDQWEGN